MEWEARFPTYIDALGLVSHLLRYHDPENRPIPNSMRRAGPVSTSLPISSGTCELPETL